MLKQHSIYFEWIREAISQIRIYTKNVSEDDFLSNNMMQDACLIQLQHIGETIVQIDKHFGDNIFIQDRKEIIGFRNLISHQYKAVRAGFIWNIIKTKLNILEDNINSFRRK